MFDTYRDFCSKYQNALKEKLSIEKIDESTINNILDSGFYLFQNQVVDGYYGLRNAVSIDSFIDHLKGKTYLNLNLNIPTYEINSLDDAIKILENDQYKLHLDNLCFRGQTSHYTTKRPFPHPFFANKNGEETLLLPGIWRQYLDKNKHASNNRPYFTNPSFLSCIEDRLIFHGIDVENLRKKNFVKYGIYSSDDVEDFPEEDNREYWKRLQLKKNPTYKEFVKALIEQHYGLDTIGLDVTFDIKTALFFATNKFTNQGTKAVYKPIEDTHSGVIYVLRFSAPTLTKTRDKIKELSGWEHLHPLRPIKQNCALPSFDSTRVNEAIPHLIAILKIGNSFDYSNTYTTQELFPSRKEDKLYNLLLELKEDFPQELNRIADYDI